MHAAHAEPAGTPRGTGRSEAGDQLAALLRS
jgi:hypothetical protein